MTRKTEAELAEYYSETRDLTGFDAGHPIPLRVKREVTISVRFSEAEIAQLRRRAEAAGLKVTSFIRAAALEAANPVDPEELARLASDLERSASRATQLASRATRPRKRQKL